MEIRVQQEGFGPGAELDTFTARASGAGAIVSFSGIVRNDDGGLTAMLVEHYPGMTERALEDIASQAMTRWHLTGALVIHRFGILAPGEPIMMVATAARHRRAAFEAAEFLMDYLKSRAPFWKQEQGPEGARWVAARSEDEDALARW